MGMPSGEAAKSLKRVRPKKRSRTISKVQRSPKMSSENATDKVSASSEALSAVLISTGNRHEPIMPQDSLAIHKFVTCILQVLLNNILEMTVN